MINKKVSARQTENAILLAGILVIGLLILFFTLHTDRAARSFDATFVPPQTIPGLEEPRFFLDNDAYAWMAHTRDLMKSGGWRLRHTYMDNAPYGREMHWSHSLIWSLRGMATVIMRQTGLTAARSVELAGVWVMPLFQFLFASAFFVLITRKLGWISAALFCGMFMTLNGFVWSFHPMRPDHHGLQLFVVIGSFLCLQFGGFGWTQHSVGVNASRDGAWLKAVTNPDANIARRWFVAAGVLGGLGLWLGATAWFFALVIIGVSAASILPGSQVAPSEANLKYDATLWRWWAWTGVGVGAFFYLLEYAPDHFSMRLEVNHPWHWLFWIGLAEGMYRIGRTPGFFDLKDIGASRDRWLAALATAAVISLPLVILFGPPEWHQMRNIYLQRLHGELIEEFTGAWSAMMVEGPVTFLFLRMGILPLVIFLAIWAMVRSPASRHLLIPGLIFSLIWLLLFLWQQRWGFFLAGALALLAVLVIAEAGARVLEYRPVRRWSLFFALLLAVNCVVAAGFRIRSEQLTANATGVIPAWVHSCFMKRMVLQWGLAAGNESWRMAGMAIEAPMLYYFAGIRTVASYYWENAAGWEAETRFFADGPEGKEALSIASARGLTHASISLTTILPKFYWYLYTGRQSETEAMSATLAGCLAVKGGRALPSWIEYDVPLSAIGEKVYVLNTPRGYAKEKTSGQVFRLRPERADK